jgi:Protein of unknown function (DUF3592)
MRAQALFMRFVTHSFWLWFGGIWCAVGLPFLIAGIVMAHTERTYQRDGHVIPGVVISKAIQRATKDQGTSYRVTYRFSTPHEQLVEGHATVSRNTWDALTEEGPVAVRYLPQAPTTNRLEGESAWFLALIFLGLGGVFAPVGGVLLLKGLRRLRTERRLLQSGLVAEGTVTEVAESNLRINNQHLWVIRYRYQDHLGRPHEGQSGYLNAQEAAAWQIGDTGTVRFDRYHPAHSLWLGKDSMRSLAREDTPTSEVEGLTLPDASTPNVTSQQHSE